MEEHETPGDRVGKRPDDEIVYSTDVTSESTATESHDQNVPGKTNPATDPSPSIMSVAEGQQTSQPGGGLPRLQSIRGPRGTHMYHPISSLPLVVADDRRPPEWPTTFNFSTTPLNPETAPFIPFSDEGQSTLVDLESTISPAPGWRSYSGFRLPRSEPLPEDSPISPQTIRPLPGSKPQPVPAAASETHPSVPAKSDSINFAIVASSEPLNVQTTSSEQAPNPPVGQPKYPAFPAEEAPYLEGYAVPNQDFHPPRSERPSAEIQKAPGRDTVEPSVYIQPSPFVDPSVRLGNSSPALGLPSIRKILNSPCEPFDILPFQEDLKAVNSLETFQKEATKAWEQSQQFYGWDREKMMTLMLASSWDLNLRLLTGMLRANNFLRTLQSMHRTSLGEIERLQQHSEEDQAEGFESKRKLSFTIEELKDMVKELRLQLALRDYAVANDKKEAESMEMRMWLDEEAFPMETRSHITKDQDPKDTDFMNRDSLELYDIKVNLEEPPTPQKRVLDWPAVMPPIKEKPWLDIEKRKSWEPDHDDTEELLQKIKALREELDHERFQKEHLEEALETMEGGEKEVDNAHTQAARRIAEKVGLAAALITTQRSLTDEKDRNVLLQKHVDAMEEEIATKDHKIKKLERELQETTAEMRQERRDATDAKFEAEDLRSKTQDLQIEISSLERQIGVLKVELATAEKDLLESLHQSQAWSDRQDDLERQIAELETQFYDTATDKGMLIQDVEMYQRQIAELDTQLYDAETEKGMLIQDVDMYQKQVAELETQFYDAETSKRMLIQDVEMYQQKYRDLVREFQDFREQHKTGTEDEEKEPPAVTEDVAATEDVDFHKMIETYETAIKDLRELLSTKEEQLSSHRAQNQKLADTLKSLRESTKKREEDQRDINKQRDETLAALRSKREYMLQRVRVLRTQGAAWRQELEGMAARRQHAEELYQQAHGALTTALEDLARMRAEEVVYGARERELEERVEMLYGELERRRRALQDMRLQILSGTEILKSHDRETDDVRGFLAALGADVKASIDLTYTDLPSPSGKGIKVVQHRHSEACFCSLVEYWFPGALDGILPPIKRDRVDSGYGSGGNYDEGEEYEDDDEDADPPDLGGGSGVDGIELDEGEFTPRTVKTWRMQDEILHQVLPQRYGPPKQGPVYEEPDIYSPDSPTHDAGSTGWTGTASGDLNFDNLTREDYENFGLNNIDIDDGWGPVPLRGGSLSSDSDVVDWKEEAAGHVPLDERVEEHLPRLGTGDDDTASEVSLTYGEKPATSAHDEPDEKEKWEDVKFSAGTDDDEPNPEDSLPVVGTGDDTTGLVSRPNYYAQLEGFTPEAELERSQAELLEKLFKPEISQTEPFFPTKHKVPESSQSERAGHEPSEPEPSQAEPSEPETSRPEASQAEPTQPQPLSSQPGSPQPGPSQPSSSQPGPTQTQPNPPTRKPRPTRLTQHPTIQPTPLADLLTPALAPPQPPPPTLPLPQTRQANICTCTCPTHRPSRFYHGHTSSNKPDPFSNPIALLCQALTALTWLALLIASLPGGFLSTLGIALGYFLLPLGYILRLGLHYLRLTLRRSKLALGLKLGEEPHPPARPRLGRPSAAGAVSSVVCLGVVFLCVALQALAYERGVWLRANRWTDAYVRDILDRRPYPAWLPVDVDFRLALYQWLGWKVNVWAFGERYLGL